MIMKEIYENLLTKDWVKEFTSEFFESEYFKKLGIFLNREYNTYNCFPKRENIFKVMLDVANKEEQGFVTYLWKKDSKSDKLDEKITYIKKFKEWGFILGSGIYIDDINKQFYENIVKAIAITLVILAIINFVLLFISRSIINSFKTFQTGLLGFFAYLNRESSDTKLLDDSSKDDFGQMSKVVN